MTLPDYERLFDLSDVTREAWLCERIAWSERQIQNVLAHRRRMFVNGFQAALDLLESGATYAEIVDFYEELT